MSIGVSSTNDLFHDHHLITNFFLSLHPHNTMSDTGRQSFTDKFTAAAKVCTTSPSFVQVAGAPF